MSAKQEQTVRETAKAPPKPIYKYLPGILPVIIVICLIAALLVAIPAVRRKGAISQAGVLLEQSRFDQAEQALTPYLSHPEAKAMQEEITYARAVQAAQSNILDAKVYMDLIPGHSDPHRLRRKIKFAQALAAADTGDYETAYQMMDELGAFSEAATRKEMLCYEALALRTLFSQKASLTVPDSLQVKKVTFYSGTDGVVDLLAEITGDDGTGNTVGGYVYDVALNDGEKDAGVLSYSDYTDPSTTAQSLQGLLVAAIKGQDVVDVTVDMQRINRLLQEGTACKLALPISATEKQ